MPDALAEVLSFAFAKAFGVDAGAAPPRREEISTKAYEATLRVVGTLKAREGAKLRRIDGLSGRSFHAAFEKLLHAIVTEACGRTGVDEDAFLSRAERTPFGRYASGVGYIWH